MKSWKKVIPDETIKVGWRTLVRKKFVNPNGEEVEYVIKDEIGARSGAVIALTSDNKVVIAEQFRPGPEKYMQEIPGGGIKPGEDPQEAVMRELKEETGYTSDEVEFLGSVTQDAYSNNEWYFYLAKNCYLLQDQELDRGEFVSIKLISIDKLIENARNGRMTDVSALFFAYESLSKLRK